MVRREFLHAAAVRAAYRAKGEKPTRIEDISRNLFSLSQSGINLGEISLKRVPGGFYSEDVEILVGHFLDANFAIRRSPVQLTRKARRFGILLSIKKRRKTLKESGKSKLPCANLAEPN